MPRSRLSTPLLLLPSVEDILSLQSGRTLDAQLRDKYTHILLGSCRNSNASSLRLHVVTFPVGGINGRFSRFRISHGQRKQANPVLFEELKSTYSLEYLAVIGGGGECAVKSRAAGSIS
jgi:hypothetical protein